jgi:16S rRNA processing protein RimM
MVGTGGTPSATLKPLPTINSQFSTLNYQRSTMWIEIGTIVAAQGLYGEVRVYPNSDFPERFIEPGKRWLLHPNQTEPEPIEFLGGRYIPGKGLYAVELEGIENRSEAEALRGCKLFVEKGDRPYLEPDEFYIQDLLDLEVFNQLTGEVLGKVIDIIPAGNDLLEVELYRSRSEIETAAPAEVTPPKSTQFERKKARKKQQKKSDREPKPATVLIPFVQEIVPIVDLENGRIEISPPPGLLE